MIPNDYKTSIRIPSQLPEFIRDDLNYETFVAFVQAYYEWMELADTANANTTIVSTTQQGVTTASKNILNYTDVDETLDGFIEYYINDFLPYFPEGALSDKRKILKIAKQFYDTKGTPGSYELLFRLLYNSPAKILETGELVFRPSDGNWYIPKLLKVKGDSSLWLSDPIRNMRVFGETSKTFANLDRVYLNIDKLDIYISDIERLFQSGEIVRIVDSNNQDVYVLDGEIVTQDTPGASLVSGKLVGAISNINIDPKYRGLTYNVGDPVVVYGGLNTIDGLGATAEVSEITRGSVQRIYVTDGGYGYRTGTTTNQSVTDYPNTAITIVPVTGGALAHVADYNTASENVANVTLLTTNRISIKQLIPLNNTAYNFVGMPTANANTRLIDALSFDSFTTYPISSVIVDNGGGGFSQLPSVTAESHFYDIETGEVQHLSNMGILAPILINNGGNGYKVNTRIMLVGGSGQGASANVKTVDANGKILTVEYVNYEEPLEIYPKGGMGYVAEDFTGTTFNPFNIYTSSIVKIGTVTGAFQFKEQVYQGANLAYASFTGYVSGYETSNLSVYNTSGTLQSNVLIKGNTSSASANVTSSTMIGANASLQITDVLGSGAAFDVATDRVGSVTKIKVTNFGEDYVSTPKVSLRIQDLCVTNIADDATLQALTPGAIIFQGQDTVANTENFFVDDASYLGYVDSVTLLTGRNSIANSTYNIRVYNYFSVPRVFDETDSSNTVIQIDTEIAPYPSFKLDTGADPSYGYVNGFKQYGDGNAKASARFLNGLIYGDGKYLDTKGQPSSYSVLQNKYNNDYTYELAVEVPISLYRDMLKNILHPSGMNILGKELLDNEKSFTVRSSSTLANSYPLWIYSSTANVTMSTNFVNTATNIIQFAGITPAEMANTILPNQRILIERNGANVYSKVDSVDYANTKIITFVNPFLTYNNVAYGFANASSNIINITSNTTNYGKFINNNEWHVPEANVNPIREIMFAGDKLLMNNITYTVSTVSYGTYANTTTITLANNVVANTGNSTHPVLLSINRNIANSTAVTIYTIN
jgi:hypothetical protein